MTEPKEIDIMRPEDMCVGPYQVGEKRCLMAWKHKFFRGLAFESLFSNTMIGLFNTEITHKNTKCRNEKTGKVKQITPEDTAYMWNRTLVELGYTEGNPVKKGKIPFRVLR